MSKTSHLVVAGDVTDEAIAQQKLGLTCRYDRIFRVSDNEWRMSNIDPGAELFFDHAMGDDDDLPATCPVAEGSALEFSPAQLLRWCDDQDSETPDPMVQVVKQVYDPLHDDHNQLLALIVHTELWNGRMRDTSSLWRNNLPDGIPIFVAYPSGAFEFV